MSSNNSLSITVSMESLKAMAKNPDDRYGSVDRARIRRSWPRD